MKRHFKFIVILILSIHPLLQPLYAQQGMNQVDSEGKRDGVWKKYYTNNRIRYVGTFDHGKEVGTFKYYSASSSDYPIITKKYHENDNLAEVQFFTTTGILESKGLMKGKDREGVYCIPGHTWVKQGIKGPKNKPYIPKVRLIENRAKEA